MDNMGGGKPKHPLVTVVDLSKISIRENSAKIKLVHSFYGIILKTKAVGKLKYGRSVIDFEEGCLHGMAPGQILELGGKTEVGEMEGWALYFHPDFLHGHQLASTINNYDFFNYEANEALHLSEKEKSILNDIVKKIKEEYGGNIDEYSQSVILANIDLLLSYIKRYYNRQFITRKSINVNVLSQFEKLVKEYFMDEQVERIGLPTVQYFSEKLHLSPSYLSDLLKKETGKNAQEHIHFQLINRAKYYLLNSNKAISEIAYQLGFEHPPYFSRLFKKKMGVTPTQFRATMN